MSEAGDQLPKSSSTTDDFKWSQEKEEAALLLSVDELTDAQIAEKVGVTARSITTWKTKPAFRERIDAHLAEYRARIRRKGIAIVENRVAAVQDRWERMKRVIEARANDPEAIDIPGGDTGLLVKTVKSAGQGETIEEWQVDTGLLKELREHEKQAAQELGQWTEKQEVNGAILLKPITLDGDKQV